MSTHPSAKRHPSNVVRTNYVGHTTPNLPDYSDSYALAYATQHLRLPALDSANINELPAALDTRSIGFRDQEQSSQRLHDSRIVPYSALVIAGAPPTAQYEPPSWDTPLVHQPYPLEPYTSLATHMDPHTCKPAHPAVSCITPPDEDQHFPIKIPLSPPQKRKSVHAEAEPNTARATYLRKNRNAASKCRNKQKKEQDDLIESARATERTNKVLKAKVAILDDDLRELMVLVEQHYQCPDSRLRLYAERIGRVAPQSMDANYQL